MEIFDGPNGRLAQSIETVDALIKLSGTDYELTNTLMICRNTLAAISWERFRIRHEDLNRRAMIARRHTGFSLRHKRGNHV